jgi:antitoxin MazE
MKVKLARWGNSLAVRIPSPIADEAHLREGTSIEIAATPDGEIRLTPLKTALTIEELVAGITEHNRHDETDFGEPVGNEVW